MIEKRTPKVLKLFTTFYDLSVSRNLFSTAKMRQFRAAGAEGVIYFFKSSVKVLKEIFIFSATPSNLPCDVDNDLPFPEVGGQCEMGHYCESLSADSGAAVQIPCPPGTFQRSVGSKSCDPCEDGSFCPLGAIEPQPCPPGYECKGATKHAYDSPCEPGKYNRYG